MLLLEVWSCHDNRAPKVPAFLIIPRQIFRGRLGGKEYFPVKFGAKN